MWQSLLVLVPALLVAAPSQFEDPVSALEGLRDYRRDRGNLEIASEEPLELIVYEDFVPVDSFGHIEESTMRNAIDAVFRVFVHCPADSITITSIAITKKNIADPDSPSWPSGPSVRVTTTRAEALAALRRVIPDASYAELAGQRDYGSFVAENQWQPAFESLLFDKPKLKRLLALLQ